ncbi:MAG TPA: hypothetical protein VFJ82_04580 [Longimicrobium sp.]|nr:hypothetical protein [Longimicrobium sp.]
MPRTTIRQFRAILVDGPGRGALVRAYRELARRPVPAAAIRAAGWIEWQEATPAARHS